MNFQKQKLGSPFVFLESRVRSEVVRHSNYTTSDLRCSVGIRNWETPPYTRHCFHPLSLPQGPVSGVGIPKLPRSILKAYVVTVGYAKISCHG